MLDRSWFDAVPPDQPVFITAQGLFMYLSPSDIQSLLADMADRFPGGVVMFDIIPRWLSKKTLSSSGWQKTSTYTTPPMPWGIDRNEIIPTMRRWVPDLEAIEDIPYARFPRGFVNRWLFPLFTASPVLGRYVPSVVRLQLSDRQ